MAIATEMVPWQWKFGPNINFGAVYNGRGGMRTSAFIHALLLSFSKVD